MFLRRFCIALVVFFVSLPVSPTMVIAEEMNWTLTSKHQYIVQFKLYSNDRNHVWPTASTAWDLDDYASHTVHINCIRGERICYGAWQTGNSNIYWGGGYGNRQHCDNCCAVCGDGDVDKTLLR
jgi:hypothetical protein